MFLTDSQWLKRAAVVGIVLLSSTQGYSQISSGLQGYYNFDGNLNNTATTLGGVGGIANASYNGAGSLQFLLADSVAGSTSQLGDGFGGLTGDAVYFGGDNADIDHLVLPSFQLGNIGQDFTVNLFVAIGEDASVANSGDESTGGNGPSILGNKPVSFVDSDVPTVTGGVDTGFSYGQWSNKGDDFGVNVSDGANTSTAGVQDVGFDSYTMFTLVYDSVASELRRYQGGSLQNTVDLTGYGSFNSGNDLRLGGYPEGTTSGSDTLWGSMDDVGIWNRALSDSEIGQISTYASFGLDLEDLANGVVLPQSEFTGNSASDNLASNGGNWTVAPSLWTPDTEVIVAGGTTASGSGAQTGPAVFDSTFGSQEIRNLLVGEDGTTTTIEMSGTAEIISSGNPRTQIGLAGSNVNLTLNNSSRIEHRGDDEESSRFVIGLPGSTTNVTLNDSSELAAGPRVADAAYATGFRRPQPGNNPGEPVRAGDDLMFGESNDGDASEVNVVMNQNSVVFVPDVFYPGDSNNTVVNVTQNDNSQVLVNWDSRFLDDGHDAGEGVNWTMNGSSKFVAARDHGLGETGGEGFVNVTLNDNAEFRAGDRLVLGAGGANVTVNVNDNALLKAGGDAATDVILVDDTGEVAPGAESRAIDWILHMGGGANAVLNVSGGRVEIGRNAYIGRGGGTALANVEGGTFEVKGVGALGTGLGNGPGGGVPTEITWTNSGGAVLIGNDDGDNGTLTYKNGVVDVATDVIVGLDTSQDNTGGSGRLVTRVADGTRSGDSFSVGRNLSFGGVVFGGALIANTEGSGNLTAKLGTGDLQTIDVTGDVGIFSSGSGNPGEATFDVSFEPGDRPATGASSATQEVVSYGGTRVGEFDELDDAATRGDQGGADYTVLYDDVNKTISVRLDFVYAPGDSNYDSAVDSSDLGTWQTNYGLGGPGVDPTFAEADWVDNGVVGGLDFLSWQTSFTGTPAVGSVPEPTSMSLTALAGVALMGWRRRRN